MTKFKVWKDIILKAFSRGLAGQAPEVASPQTAKILSAVRDAILFVIELVLTVGACFTYMLTTSAILKIVLIFAILVSGLRTYATASRLWDGLFRTEENLPPQ